MAAATRRPNLKALTSLRFFAAALVVVFHFQPLPVSLPDAILAWFRVGYELVTFFFVLSGFILTYVYWTPQGLNASWRSILAARFARLAPAYYLALLLGLPLFFRHLLYVPEGRVESIFAAIATMGFAQTWLPFLPLVWNIPAWSLSVEFFLYLLFIPSSRVTGRPWLLFFGALCLLLLTTLVKAHFLVEPTVFNRPWDNFFVFFPLMHAGSFIFGIALGQLFLTARPIPPGFGDALALAALVSLTAIWMGMDHLPPWLSGSGPLSLLWGALIVGTASAGLVSRLLGARWLVVLGEASYGIYILHVPLWGLWSIAVGHAGMEASRGYSIAAFFLVLCICSVLVFRFIELPARSWLLARLRIRHDG